MPDVFNREKRSDVMSRIRGRGNKNTELALIKVLRQNHVTGWRRNQMMCGKPDFVFRKQKVAIFVDGCFWHGCPKHYKAPSSNRAFWRRKFLANAERDRLVNIILRREGWRVIRIWEHDLAHSNSKPIKRIQRAIGLPRRKPR